MKTAAEKEEGKGEEDNMRLETMYVYICGYKCHFTGATDGVMSL